MSRGDAVTEYRVTLTAEQIGEVDKMIAMQDPELRPSKAELANYLTMMTFLGKDLLDQCMRQRRASVDGGER